MSDQVMQPQTDDRKFGYRFLGGPWGISEETVDGWTNDFSQTAESLPVKVSMASSAKFALLRDRWYEERDELGPVNEMTACPSYQKIIGMGSDALPFIIKQLESEEHEPDFWFSALVSITCVNPVPVEDRGNLKKMAQAWLAWASRNGCC
jgi:hypothetical protein